MAMSYKGEGPIPGENFTSDTKNYPWHQPPEFTDLDEALEFLSRKITKFKCANGLLTMAETGIPLVRISDMIVTSGIGEGKWTPDFALMIAGPLTKMIEVMCVGFDVPYTLGIDEDEEITTGNFFKNQMSLRNFSTEEAANILEQEMDDISQAANAQSPTKNETKDLQQGGFMAMQGQTMEASQGTGGQSGPEGTPEAGAGNEPKPSEAP